MYKARLWSSFFAEKVFAETGGFFVLEVFSKKQHKNKKIYKIQSNPMHYLFILQELEIVELYIPKLTTAYCAQVEINNLLLPT